MDVPSLTSRHYETGTVTVLELHGDLVAGTVLSLQPTVAGMLADLKHPLVLDLQNVRTADTTGATMLGAVARVAPPNTPVRLAHAPTPLKAALRATGVLGAVLLFNTVDGAIREDPTDLVVHTPPTS